MTKAKGKAVPYLIQGKNIILVIDSKSHTISKDTHIAYGKIVDALKAQDWDTIREHVEPKKAILNFGKGNVSVVDNKILWKGEIFHNALATRMMEMYQEGFPIDPMIRFMENLMQNPSKRSVDQMYGFLEKNKLPITEDGFFLAFKRVRNDFRDIHSGKFDNSVGQTVSMDRNKVDDNPNSTCSSGLHFCSESYLGHFGNASQPVMVLKISPADVVSIPVDYDGAKGRCSAYQVVGQVNGDPKSAFSSVVNTEYTPPAAEAVWPTPVAVAPKAKAAKKPSAPVVLAPAAGWPFPTSSKSTVWPSVAPAPVEDLYDLQRMNGAVEYSDLTLEEAEDRQMRNASQKKAKLKIVEAGTDNEV